MSLDREWMALNMIDKVARADIFWKNCIPPANFEKEHFVPEISNKANGTVWEEKRQKPQTWSPGTRLKAFSKNTFPPP